MGGTEFPHSGIYDELEYSGNKHYISSFQDPKVLQNSYPKSR